MKISILMLTFLSMALLYDLKGDIPKVIDIPLDKLKCPQEIPKEWLNRDNHPFVFCSKEELKETRANLERREDWKNYFEKQKSICKKFIELSDEELIALVPKSGSKIIYGFGMNLDPNSEKLLWAGWTAPFKVKGKNGTIYPNADFPDDGNGFTDDKGNTYFFMANANGFIFKELEDIVIPALADVYALSGNIKYAHAAAILLDAIAKVYPTNRRGPLDYPTRPKDMNNGGRLQRPYFQVARGLQNYVNSIDLITSSGELERESCNKNEKSIRENIIRNLLWDGGIYCMQFALNCTALTNGHADYVRGGALVGLILGVNDFMKPLLDPSIGIGNMININIDRNGFYSEVAPLYSIHTADLYISMAEIIYYASKKGILEKQKSLYDEPMMRSFMSDFFSRREVGGHVPLIGDDGPDRLYKNPGIIDINDRYVKKQVEGSWITLIRTADKNIKQSSAQFLKGIYGKKLSIPDTRWFIYHISQSLVSFINEQKTCFNSLDSESVFYGAKGLALLRGGKGNLRYGAQLMFGMANCHGHKEALTWTFFIDGLEMSYTPGYCKAHYRFGWTNQSVSHQAVVVNAKSYDVDDGYGFIKAWINKPEVQCVFVEHPNAYKSEGVTKFQRLIAQVHNPITGSLGYWLDISKIHGGTTRDDSFHSAMGKVDSINMELKPIGSATLYGDKYKGEHFQDDFRLSGFPEKDFYWSAPGDGYGFLLDPIGIKTNKSLRLSFSKHVFSSSYSNLMIVDFPGEDNREYLMTKSMGAPHSPSVPYLIRRDTGMNGVSIFAKVIRFASNTSSDHIKEVIGISAMNSSKGLLIVWKNGIRDLWLLGDDDSKSETKVKFENLPEIVTDGLLTMIRFNEIGDAVFAYASGATKIEMNGNMLVSGQRMFVGKIKGIRNIEGNLVLEIDQEIFHAENMEGMPLVTRSKQSLPATWSIKKISGQKIILNDLKADMGSANFIAEDENKGIFQMPSILPLRFFSASGQVSPSVILGKKIHIKDNDVVTISAICDKGKNLNILDPVDMPLKKTCFSGYIYEMAPEDEFFVPLNLYWIPK